MDDAIYNLFLSVSADTLRKLYMAVNSLLYVIEMLLQNCHYLLNYPRIYIYVHLILKEVHYWTLHILFVFSM